MPISRRWHWTRVSTTTGAAINASTSSNGDAIDASASGTGYGLNVSSVNGSAISVNTSGVGIGVDVVTNDANGSFAVDATSSNTNGYPTMNVVNLGSSDAIDAATSGNGIVINATANGSGAGMSITANGGGDALDVTNTNAGADFAVNITNTGSGSGLAVSAASEYDAIDSTGGGSGGNALYARGSIAQQGENVDVSAGPLTLDGGTNIYELTTGGSTTVTLPQTNTQSQVIYVYNSTTHSQTVNGVSMATGHGASYVYFPSSGWILTASF